MLGQKKFKHMKLITLLMIKITIAKQLRLQRLKVYLELTFIATHTTFSFKKTLCIIRLLKQAIIKLMLQKH
ncbi:hypothetical protein D931_02007 [Enterococcus faecium 13.SD.W.09]|nr:hypothetical protein D931_02007 [Enterococcus faecium 13.SD.W.09]